MFIRTDLHMAQVNLVAAIFSFGLVFVLVSFQHAGPDVDLLHTVLFPPFFNF